MTPSISAGVRFEPHRAYSYLDFSEALGIAPRQLKRLVKSGSLPAPISPTGPLRWSFRGADLIAYFQISDAQAVSQTQGKSIQTPSDPRKRRPGRPRNSERGGIQK